MVCEPDAVRPSGPGSPIFGAPVSWVPGACSRVARGAPYGTLDLLPFVRCSILVAWSIFWDED